MTKELSEGVVHTIPQDLREALLATPEAVVAWEALTPLARNEWICWNISVKQAETRSHHIQRTVTELQEGKRRPCCWIGCIHRTDKVISPSIQGILAKRSPSDRELERIRKVVMKAVPSAQVGESYGMPAYMYKGKPLLSIMIRKNFLSLYPFSGRVIAGLENELREYETTSGSVHFTVKDSIPDSLLIRIIEARMVEIEGRTAV
jgi:uncharacterized protein YdhG (YjbR/CyaY superfamily)